MFSGLQLTGLCLAFVSLAPFGTYLPGGSTCLGVGNLWTCVGEPSARVSSVDVSHSGSTHCSCSCDGSLPLSADCSNTSRTSVVQIQQQSGFRLSTIVCAVLSTEAVAALFVWQLLSRFRSSSRLLALNDLPSREAGSSPVHRRADLVARARAAQSAAGVKVLDSDAGLAARR